MVQQQADAVNIACSSDEKAAAGNPLLEEWTTEYGVPPFDLIRTEHFKPAFDAAMQMHNEEIEVIVNTTEEPTFENVIVALDNAGVKLAELNLIFGMLSASDCDDAMQEVMNEVMPLLVEHSSAIMLNDKLFERGYFLLTGHSFPWL